MFKQLFASPKHPLDPMPFGMCNDHITRMWWMSVLFLLAVAVLVLPAFYFDSRLLDGVSLWHKPVKFALSLALHFATLALLASQLPFIRRTGPTVTAVGYAAVASMLFEQVYISLQAARGRRSHYNLDTDLEIALYDLMGVGAVMLVLASFVLGVMIWRYGAKSSSGLRLGSIAGLILGSVLTLYFAMYMANQPSHLVQLTNATVNDANGLPLLGWSRSTGDLRISHFVATHTIQFLPLLGLLLDRWRLPARGIIAVSGLILSAACIVLLRLAQSGQPLLSQ